MSSLTIPDLVVSRARAADVASVLPAMLTDSVIEVDVANVESATQSFVDEFCKQILVLRQAKCLIVHNASARFANHLHTSARLREVSDRLVVDVRG